jgi:adenylate cyclase
MYPAFAADLSEPLTTRLLIAFIDQSDFLQYAAQIDSATLFAELDQFYEFTEAAVTAAGGLVIKYLGDAVLIVFPDAQADQGIWTLIELRGELERWVSTVGNTRTVHLCAHVGKVTMGKLGRIGRVDVIGEAVNRAATLPHNGVTLTPDAYASMSLTHQALFEPRGTPPVYQLRAP